MLIPFARADMGLYIAGCRKSTMPQQMLPSDRSAGATTIILAWTSLELEGLNELDVAGDRRHMPQRAFESLVGGDHARV